MSDRLRVNKKNDDNTRKNKDPYAFTNYDDIIKNDPDIENLVYKQNPAHLPQHPFRLLICGGTGTGKTNALCDLLIDPKGLYSVNYEKVYLYAEDLTEPKYEYLIKEYTQTAQHMGVPLEEIFVYSDDPKDIIDVHDLDKNKMNIVIFDDLVTLKDQKKIKDLYKRGRKKNADVIYLTQDYFLTPIFIRRQLSNLIFFQPNQNRDKTQLSTEWGCGDRKSFIKLIDNATQDRKFLFIDVKQRYKPARYRCGFLDFSSWDE